MRRSEAATQPYMVAIRTRSSALGLQRNLYTMTEDPTGSPMAAFNLAGRRALVTGARRGIGRAIAMGLAAQGAEVAVHHADTPDEQQDAEAVVHEIFQHGGVAHRFVGDFAWPGAGETLAKHI